MKKFLRLQQIQLFLRFKKKFTLKDLMQELQISRSTALRYIADMEEMGIPLYSERGRYGGFIVAPTYQIAPIRFSSDEIKAMLFVISSMDIFQSTPFKQALSLINEKLKQVLPPEEQAAYERLNQHLSIRTPKQLYKTLYLDMLIQYILNKQNIRLVLKTGKAYSIRPLALWYGAGRWFVGGYELNVNDLRIVCCDHITVCEKEHEPFVIPDTLSLDDYHIGNIDSLRQYKKQSLFHIEIQDEGIDRFKSHSFPHIQAKKTQNGYLLSAHYHEDEFEYVMDYINGFSRYLIDIKPIELKRQYKDMVKLRLKKLFDGRTPSNH